MSNPDSRAMPWSGPPRPMTISRRTRSSMSRARRQATFCSREGRRRLSNWRWLSTIAARRLWAAVMACISPVKWRLMSSLGTTRARPPPVAPPFMPEDGPERRLADRHGRRPSQPIQGVRQPDRRCRFSFARRRRRHRRDHDQPAGTFSAGLVLAKVDLGLVRAVFFQILRLNPDASGDLFDRLRGRVNIRLLGHEFLPSLSVYPEGGIHSRNGPERHPVSRDSAANSLFVYFQEQQVVVVDQSAVGEAEITVVADHDMVEDLELHDFGRKNQLFRDFPVA